VFAVGLFFFGLLTPSWSFAQTCTVPGSHPTIQDAVDDPACTSIDLAAQSYQESIEIRRSLTLGGPAAGGAVIERLVLLSGDGVVVDLEHLEVANGCTPDAMGATGGATVSATNVSVQRAAGLSCPELASSIFSDGFETGGTGAWSSATP
jgi:hypothetical protein